MKTFDSLAQTPDRLAVFVAEQLIDDGPDDAVFVDAVWDSKLSCSAQGLLLNVDAVRHDIQWDKYNTVDRNNQLYVVLGHRYWVPGEIV